MGTLAVTLLSEMMVGVRAAVVAPAFHWTAVTPVRPLPFKVKTKGEVAAAWVEIGDSELTRGPENEKLVSTRDQAPRPCVPAIKVREAS